MDLTMVLSCVFRSNSKDALVIQRILYELSVRIHGSKIKVRNDVNINTLTQ